jgi:hypothetical protein
VDLEVSVKLEEEEAPVIVTIDCARLKQINKESG